MSEHGEQAAVVHWARMKGLDTLFAIPNGAKLPYTRGANGRRYSRQALILIEEGLLPGVSDLFLPIANSEYHGLFIEMKDGKNKATPDQKVFLEKMEEAGYKSQICYGADEAIRSIEDYLGWKHE